MPAARLEGESGNRRRRASCGYTCVHPDLRDTRRGGHRVARHAARSRHNRAGRGGLTTRTHTELASARHTFSRPPGIDLNITSNALRDVRRLRERRPSTAALRRAYRLRDRASDHEKFFINFSCLRLYLTV